MKKLVVKQDPENEQPFEVMAEAIVAIGKAVRDLRKSRVTDKMIIALIKDNIGVPKIVIENVLNSLSCLESNYLKPEAKR